MFSFVVAICSPSLPEKQLFSSENVLKLKFDEITKEDNSPTEYGSKIIEYFPDSIFFGFM